jgi:hypothetical protein
MLIQRGAVSERVNIRRVTPYFEREDHWGSECTILAIVLLW